MSDRPDLEGVAEGRASGRHPQIIGVGAPAPTVPEIAIEPAYLRDGVLSRQTEQGFVPLVAQDAALAARGIFDQTDSLAKAREGRAKAATFLQWTEAWANLTAWVASASGTTQVNGGKLYGNATGTAPAVSRSFNPPNGFYGRFSGSLVVVAAAGGTLGSAGMTGVGTGKQTIGAAPVAASSTFIAVDQATNRPVKVIDGVVTQLSASALAAGTYQVTVIALEDWTSYTITSSDGMVEVGFKVDKATEAPNNLIVWNGDTRGTSGCALGACNSLVWGGQIVPHDSLTGEGSGPRAVHLKYKLRDGSSVDSARVVVPKAYDARTPMPVLLKLHSANAAAQWQDGSHADGFGFERDLLSDGFMVAEFEAGGDHWANTAAIQAAEDFYVWLRTHYAVGPVVLFASSMGTLLALNILARRKIPNIVGLIALQPVTNLAAIWAEGGGLKTQIQTAYGIASDGSDYGSRTAGHDALQMAGSAFRGVPVQLVASSGDTVAVKSDNADRLAAKLAGIADVDIFAATGNHTDLSHYSYLAQHRAAAKRWVGYASA